MNNENTLTVEENLLNNSKTLKIGTCIELDMCFASIFDNFETLSGLLSNYKVLSKDFPDYIFDIKITSLIDDVSFLEKLLFSMIDSSEEYCNYLYKYND